MSRDRKTKKRSKLNKPPKEYVVRQIDYLAYNTLFSMQTLIEHLREIKELCRENLRINARLQQQLHALKEATPNSPPDGTSSTTAREVE